MQCHSVSAKTRGDDIGRLKDQLENLVYFEDRNLYKDKASRGWEHNETARLLMPVGMLDEHEDDITRYVQYLTGDVFSPVNFLAAFVALSKKARSRSYPGTGPSYSMTSRCVSAISRPLDSSTAQCLLRYELIGLSRDGD